MSKHHDEVTIESMVEQLKDLPDTWVLCRDVKHAWTVETDFHVTDYKGGDIHEIRRIMRCLRCGTDRHETYVPSKRWGLEKTTQHYAYPDGYQFHGTPRGVKPSWLIQGEQYRRAMERVAALQREHKSEDIQA